MAGALPRLGRTEGAGWRENTGPITLQLFHNRPIRDKLGKPVCMAGVEHVIHPKVGGGKHAGCLLHSLLGRRCFIITTI